MSSELQCSMRNTAHIGGSISNGIGSVPTGDSLETTAGMSSGIETGKQKVLSLTQRIIQGKNIADSGYCR